MLPRTALVSSQSPQDFSGGGGVGESDGFRYPKTKNRANRNRSAHFGEPKTDLAQPTRPRPYLLSGLSLAHRLDHLTQVVPSNVPGVLEILEGVDQVRFMALTTTIGVDRELDPTFTRVRSHLPVREKGLGLVRSADVARSAFVGAMEMAIPRFVDRVGASGQQVAGLFPHLVVVTGSAFGELRGRWTALINSGLSLAWRTLRHGNTCVRSATTRASSNLR